MLVLSRKKGEQLIISDNIIITVLEIGNELKLGIDAPKKVKIVRKELLDSVKETNQKSTQVSVEAIEQLERLLK